MKSSPNSAVIWRYVIKYDGGLAPHISGGLCSLALCKPRIRRYAKPGEWIIAFVAKGKANGRPLIQYAMKVAENPSFENYCIQYGGKRRDAIYRYDLSPNGEWFDNGYGDHDPLENKKSELRDKGGEHALIAAEFIHFGSEPRDLRLVLMPACDALGIDVETVVDCLMHWTQGHKKWCSRQVYKVFTTWIEGLQKSKEPPPHHKPWPPVAGP